MSSSNNHTFSEENQLSIEEPLAAVEVKTNKAGSFFRQQWLKLLYEIRVLFTFHPQEWLSAFRRNKKYPLFSYGDIDGLVALFIDNLATLLTLILALQSVLDADIVYGKIVTG